MGSKVSSGINASGSLPLTQQKACRTTLTQQASNMIKQQAHVGSAKKVLLQGSEMSAVHDTPTAGPPAAGPSAPVPPGGGGGASGASPGGNGGGVMPAGKASGLPGAGDVSLSDDGDSSGLAVELGDGDLLPPPLPPPPPLSPPLPTLLPPPPPPTGTGMGTGTGTGTTTVPPPPPPPLGSGTKMGAPPPPPPLGTGTKIVGPGVPAAPGAPAHHGQMVVLMQSGSPTGSTSAGREQQLNSRSERATTAHTTSIVFHHQSHTHHNASPPRQPTWRSCWS